MVTQYTFWIALLCFAAGFVYFLMERSSVEEEYRSTATIAAIICLIAGANYFAMRGMVGMDGTVASILNFPTEFRYLDWLITTPLILVKFPNLLGGGDDQKQTLVTLVFADVVMIVTGFVGELAINEGNKTLGFWMFLAGMIAWIFIIYILFAVVSTAADRKIEPIRVAINQLKYFILIGWAVYPVGYFMAFFGAGEEGQILRELLYNVADVVNKVGFGIVALLAVRSISKESAIRRAIADL